MKFATQAAGVSFNVRNVHPLSFWFRSGPVRTRRGVAGPARVNSFTGYFCLFRLTRFQYDGRVTYQNPYNFAAFSRSTIRASSTARPREISPSRTIPLSASASAFRPVTALSVPVSAHPMLSS